MNHDAMTELGRLLTGRFQLEHSLGAGEHTVIYAAISVKKTARRYALKCYKPSGEAERYMVSGLLQRAGATLELRHENILGVHGYVLEKDYYIIVMDVADGHDAATYLKKIGPLAPYDAWTTAQGVLAGLVHAHAQGIIHGNLKPSNIFLPIVAEAPVLLSDFRLGALGWNSTTTIYAAPEFLKNQHEDPRSDLYSLGIILYELLIGTLPFTITIKSDDGRKLQRSRIDPEALQALPQPLNDLVTRLLQREPEKRFASAAEALQAMTPDLARHLSRTRTETGVDDRRISTLLEEARRAVEQREPERARELLAEAIRLHPNDLAIKAEHDKVNDVIRQKNLADEAIAAGRQAMREQRYAEAVRHLVQAETIAPDNRELAMLVVKARQLLAAANRAKATVQEPPPTSLLPPVPPPEPSPPSFIEPVPEPPQPEPAPPPNRRPPPTSVPAHHPPAQIPWGIVAALSTGFLVVVASIAALLWSGTLHNPLAKQLPLLPTAIPSLATVAASLSAADELNDLWSEAAMTAHVTDQEDGDSDLDALLSEAEQTNQSYSEPLLPTASPVLQADSEIASTELSLFEELEEVDDEATSTSPSKAMLVFRTIPSTMIADVYLDDHYLGSTVRESEETPPLYKEAVTIGVHEIEFINKATGEKDPYRLTIPDGAPRVYGLTIEYSPELPQPPPPNLTSNIPTPAPSELESPPKASDD